MKEVLLLQKPPQSKPGRIARVDQHAAVGSSADITIASLLVLTNAGGRKSLPIAMGQRHVLLLILLVSFASIFATREVSIAVWSDG